MATTPAPKLESVLMELQRTMTLEIALSQPQQIASLKKSNPAQLAATFAVCLSALSRSLNATNTLNEFQIDDLVEILMEKYWMLRPEEILYVFKKAKTGSYGTDYNRLDSITVCTWIDKYDTGERVDYWHKHNQRLNQMRNDEQAFMADYLDQIRQSAMEGTNRILEESKRKREEAAKPTRVEYYRQRYLEERDKPGFALAKFEESVSKEIETAKLN